MSARRLAFPVALTLALSGCGGDSTGPGDAARRPAGALGIGR